MYPYRASLVLSNPDRRAKNYLKGHSVQIVILKPVKKPVRFATYDVS